MKLFLFVPLLILFASPISAQDFEKSIGVTKGASNGIYIEIPNDELTSYRFMIQNRDRGYTFTAFKIYKHYDIDKLPNELSLYYGFGVHGGFVSWEETINKGKHDEEDITFSSPVFGLDGIIGFSYALGKTPLSITLDVKPFFEFGGPRLFRVSPFYSSIGLNLNF